MEDVLDGELVTAASRGCGRSTEELVRRYWGWLVGRLVGSGHDRETAQDAAQEAFAALQEHVGEIRDPRQVRYWLLTTAQRAARRAPSKDIPVAVIPDVPADACETHDGLQAVLARDEQRRMTQALARLVPRDQLALRMRFYEGREPSEVAAALGVTEVAERSITLRARRRLASVYRQLPVVYLAIWLRARFHRSRTQPGVAAAPLQIATATLLGALSLVPTPTPALGDETTGGGTILPAGPVVTTGTSDQISPGTFESSATDQSPVGVLHLPPSHTSDRLPHEAPGSADSKSRTMARVGDWEVVTEHDELPPDPLVVLTVPLIEQDALALYAPQTDTLVPPGGATEDTTDMFPEVGLTSPPPSDAAAETSPTGVIPEPQGP